MMMVIGVASPAVAKSPEADLKTKKAATIVAGDSAWLAINWKGNSGEITNFQVTAEAPAGIEVAYPDNTPGFTGLMNGHVLSEKELDYTALRVSVPYGQTEDFEIVLTASYMSDGIAVKDTFNVKVPVAVYEADQDIVQVTGSAGSIPAGDADWAEVDFSGLAPMAEGFQMVVTDSDGLTIEYPTDEPFTSLYFDSALEDGETDFAAFWVDTTDAAAGTYTLSLEVTYRMAGQTKTVNGTLSLDVTG